jgi:hypothetical protein
MFGWFKKKPLPDETDSGDSDGAAADITPVFELAGWCAAEAILNLSQAYQSALEPGQPALLPSLVMQVPSGKRAITVFDTAGPETFEKVEVLLNQFTPSDKWAVVISDGYVHIDGQKFDSVNINGHLLVEPRQSFLLAIPYEPPHGDRPFGFRSATLVSAEGFDTDSIDISAAVVRGREGHPNAKALWDAYFRSGE